MHRVTAPVDAIERHLKFLLCVGAVFFGLVNQANAQPRFAQALEEMPSASNLAYEFWASWIGGTWHIDTQSGGGHEFRARSSFTWGPGKRFIIVKTSVVDAEGLELEHYKNRLVVVEDHVVNYRFASDGSVEAIEERAVSEGIIESTWTSRGLRLRKRVKFIAPDKMAWELCVQERDGQWRNLIKGVWFRRQ